MHIVRDYRKPEINRSLLLAQDIDDSLGIEVDCAVDPLVTIIEQDTVLQIHRWDRHFVGRSMIPRYPEGRLEAGEGWARHLGRVVANRSLNAMHPCLEKLNPCWGAD